MTQNSQKFISFCFNFYCDFCAVYLLVQTAQQVLPSMEHHLQALKSTAGSPLTGHIMATELLKMPPAFAMESSSFFMDPSVTEHQEPGGPGKEISFLFFFLRFVCGFESVMSWTLSCTQSTTHSPDCTTAAKETCFTPICAFTHTQHTSHWPITHTSVHTLALCVHKQEHCTLSLPPPTHTKPHTHTNLHTVKHACEVCGLSPKHHVHA